MDINVFLDSLRAFIDTFGSFIVIPIILFFISLMFGINLRKSFLSSLYAAIGLIGFGWLLSEFLPVIRPVVKDFIATTGINLPVLDIGWQATAIVAYGTKIGMIYLALGLALQFVLFITKWTNVFQPSGLWDLYSYAVWGSMIYLVTDDLWLSILFMVTLNLYATILYEVMAKRWSTYYKYPNCTIVQLHHMDTVPLFIFLNWILNKMGAYKIRWSPDNLREKLGFMGEPIVLGFFVGFVLGLFGNFYKLNTMVGWSSVFTMAVATAAVMGIFPRVASLFAQAFTDLAVASRKKVRRKGEDIYIGMDDAAGYGEPATLISGIIMIPIYMMIAIFLPGNRVLPLMDLTSIPFKSQTITSLSNGNVFKSVICLSIYFCFALLMATTFAPLFTQVLQQVAPAQLGDASGLVIGAGILGKMTWGSMTLAIINFGWPALIALFVAYWPLALLFKKNKTKIVDWIEAQATYGDDIVPVEQAVPGVAGD